MFEGTDTAARRIWLVNPNCSEAGIRRVATYRAFDNVMPFCHAIRSRCVRIVAIDRPVSFEDPVHDFRTIEADRELNRPGSPSVPPCLRAFVPVHLNTTDGSSLSTRTIPSIP